MKSLIKFSLAILIATPLARPITAEEGDAVHLGAIDEQITATNMILDDSTGEAVGVSETSILNPSGETTQETVSAAGPQPNRAPEFSDILWNCISGSGTAEAIVADPDGDPIVLNWVPQPPDDMYVSNLTCVDPPVCRSITFDHTKGGGITIFPTACDDKMACYTAPSWCLIH